jgi:hypothetical protein
VLLPEEQALLLASPVPPQTALSMIGSLISSSGMTIDSKTHMVRPRGAGGRVCVVAHVRGGGGGCWKWDRGMKGGWRLMPHAPALGL